MVSRIQAPSKHGETNPAFEDMMKQIGWFCEESVGAVVRGSSEVLLCSRRREQTSNKVCASYAQKVDTTPPIASLAVWVHTELLVTTI